VFEVGFMLGAAAVAIWIDARFPQLAPASLGTRLVALLLSGLIVAVAPVLAASPAEILASLFGLIFPAFVFSFLSALWLLRGLRDAHGLTR
jgi:hypothetical protein